MTRSDRGWSVWLGCTLFFMTLSYVASTSPTLPALALSEGYSPGEVGLLVAAPALVLGLLARPLPYPRFANGARLPLLTAGAFAVLPLLYALAGDLWHLLALRVLHGLALALVGAVAVSSLGALQGARGRGYCGAGQLAAWSVAPAAAGFLAERAGLFSALLMSSASGLLACLGLAIFVLGGRASLADEERVPEVGESVALLPLFAVVGLLDGFLLVDMRDLGVGSLQAGIVLGGTALFLGLAATVGRYYRRLAEAPLEVSVGGLLLATTGLAALGLVASVPALAGAAICLALGLGLARSAFTPVAMPEGKRSVVGKAIGDGSALAYALGAVYGGVGATLAGGTSTFLLAAIFLACLGLVLALRNALVGTGAAFRRSDG
ncbi:MAG: MFS transporter [Chloroflexota bacterium]